MDLVFNNQYLLAQDGKTIDNYRDQYSSSGESISLRDLYVVGGEQLFKGFWVVTLSSILLGYTLCYIQNEYTG